MFGTSRDTVYGAIFDVGVDGVSGTLVSLQSGEENPVTIFTHDERIEKGREMDESRLVYALKAVGAALEKEGQKALVNLDKGARVTKVVAVVRAPWSMTRSYNVHFEKDEPFLVTAKLLDELEEAAEKDDAHNKYLDEEAEKEPLERTFIDIKINGYDIREPIGMKGSMLDLTEVVSFLEPKAKQAIEEAVERLYPRARLYIGTHALASYFALRGAQGLGSSFVFVHAFRETTEIGIVHKNALVASTYVDEGIDSLVRHLCEPNLLPEGHARSQLCLLEETTLDDESLAAITIHFNDYTDKLTKAFTTMMREHVISRPVHIANDAPFSGVLKEKILFAIKDATNQVHVATETDTRVGTNFSGVIAGRFFATLLLEGKF